MDNKTWVRVAKESTAPDAKYIVVEINELPADLVPGKDIFPADMAALMFDVTAMNPKPTFGWRHGADGKFSPPEA